MIDLKTRTAFLYAGRFKGKYSQCMVDFPGFNEENNFKLSDCNSHGCHSAILIIYVNNNGFTSFICPDIKTTLKSILFQNSLLELHGRSGKICYYDNCCILGH